MADQKVTWWKKYRKDVFLALAILTGLVVAVMGWHWTDTAVKPFWQVFWVVAAVTCIIVWVGLWAYFWTKDKRPRK